MPIVRNNEQVTDDAVTDDVVQSQATEGDASGQSSEGSTDASQVTSSSSDIYSELGLGDDWKGKPLEDVAKHLHGRSREAEERARQQVQGIYSDPKYQEYMKWRREEANKQAAPETKKEEKNPLWNPPPFDERVIEQWTQIGENGQRQWKANTPPSVISEAQAYYNYVADFDAKFRKNPYEAFEPFVTSKAEEIARQIVEKQMRETQAHSKMIEFERQNKEWLYDLDEHGNIQYDEHGQASLTPYGKSMLETSAYVRHAANDQTTLAQISAQLVRAQVVEAEYRKLLAEKEAVTKNEDGKQAFYQKAAERTATRAGTQTRPGAKDKFPQNRKASFKEQARQALTEAGAVGDSIRWE